jgi:hypothetical protein
MAHVCIATSALTATGDLTIQSVIMGCRSIHGPPSLCRRIRACPRTSSSTSSRTECADQPCPHGGISWRIARSGKLSLFSLLWTLFRSLSSRNSICQRAAILDRLSLIRSHAARVKRSLMRQSGKFDDILFGDRPWANGHYLQLLLQLGTGLRFAQSLSKVSAFPMAQGESCNRHCPPLPGSNCSDQRCNVRAW